MFGFDGPFSEDPLTISPDTADTVGDWDTFAVAGSGGTGTGFVYSFVANNSGGTLHPTTGAYVPGLVVSGSVVDTIRVTDSGANTADATITVYAKLKITPLESSVDGGGSVAFSASGGIAPRTFSLAVNGSGGNINSSSGAYTAGSNQPPTSIEVTPANGTEISQAQAIEAEFFGGSAWITAQYDNSPAVELVHDGTDYAPRFAESTRDQATSEDVVTVADTAGAYHTAMPPEATAVVHVAAEGYHYSIRRLGGWPGRRVRLKFYRI